MQYLSKSVTLMLTAVALLGLSLTALNAEQVRDPE